MQLGGQPEEHVTWHENRVRQDGRLLHRNLMMRNLMPRAFVNEHRKLKKKRGNNLKSASTKELPNIYIYMQVLLCVLICI